MIKITLKAGKDEFVKRFHPWIFSGAIARTEGNPKDGDLAEVYDKPGNLLGIGHFHHGSIAVRMLTFTQADVDSLEFWTEKFEKAFAVRRSLGLVGDGDTSCYRLAHGEGDGLSGLIVDVYGTTAVVQCHSIGMHRQAKLIAQAIRNVLGKHIAIYDKSVESLPPKYASYLENGFLLGNSDISTVSENDVKFKIDWVTGQKTGFFLDQRDNRLLLTKFVNNKTVLNAFCYTGGFSMYALLAGAKEVHSVDSSAKAMDLVAENVLLNSSFTGKHQGFCEDVQQFLKETEQKYEVMIIDPPAYAKTLEKRHNAVQGYKRLNIAAMQKVAPGGILFTFSCSQVVDRALFYNTIVAAALEAGRNVRVLHHLTQGGDHPVSLFHPEGAYLKGLVLHVE
jgi:23S rRNA (cytosine1962-C5)-methyltransferase